MKRNLTHRLALAALVGLLALVLAPAHAQAPAGPTGKIHGRVINPTGQPQGSGTVSLSTDGGVTLKYNFPVSDTGDYSGEAPAGTYMVVYRAPDTPAGKIVDSIRGVKVVAGQDTTQDVDMSRQEYIDKLPEDQRKQLEDMKKTNAEAVKANVLINQLNADLKACSQDRKDIDTAAATAAQTLGSSASKADIAAKVTEIRTAKYNDIASLMTKDTGLKPDEPLLWNQLAYAQAGLEKYDDAITSYKKAIDLENAAKKPRLPVVGQAEAGLGEIYARTGKVPDANTAYAAAAKDDPNNAMVYLKNQAIIFFQENNGASAAWAGPAQVAAADQAIKAAPNPNDPNLAILYYIKGQGLIVNANVDPKTGKYILPPDCTAAYEKYLDLAPNGQFAQEVAGILQQAGEKVSSSYKAPKSK